MLTSDTNSFVLVVNISLPYVLGTTLLIELYFQLCSNKRPSVSYRQACLVYPHIHISYLFLFLHMLLLILSFLIRMQLSFKFFSFYYINSLKKYFSMYPIYGRHYSDTRDTTVKKKKKIPVLVELTFRWHVMAVCKARWVIE